MEEIVLLDAVERYLNGEMTAQEKSYFEDLRRNNSEVDQLVVEHQFFLNQVNNYAGQKEFKALLNETHNQLVADGVITQNLPSKSGLVIRLWNKNRRTIAVAASIACVTALTISGMLSYITPKHAQDNQQQIQLLSRKLSQMEKKQTEQAMRIDSIDGKTVITSSDPNLVQKDVATSFLIDAKGYLITNSHVVENAKAIVVNNNGRDYYATVVANDPKSDLAILKIQGKNFAGTTALPYSFRKTPVQLGEEIFTLGYPRKEIVYGKGYLSAQSGYDDDSLSVQISITANPGNSGGPIFDKNGDVIGILTSRERNVDGVVFANKSSNISKMLETLRKEDTTFNSIKLSAKNSFKSKETTQQIDQLKNCVFMVKVFY